MIEIKYLEENCLSVGIVSVPVGGVFQVLKSVIPGA
jgi:hypothetical protein